MIHKLCIPKDILDMCVYVTVWLLSFCRTKDNHKRRGIKFNKQIKAPLTAGCSLDTRWQRRAQLSATKQECKLI